MKYLRLVMINIYNESPCELLRIESHKTGDLYTQINHMFQPKTAAPSFVSPPSSRVHVVHNILSMVVPQFDREQEVST